MRVGGAYFIQSVAAGIGVTGEFVELDAPRRIRMTWRWLSDGVSAAEEPVEVSFERRGRGTHVTVSHELADFPAEGDDIRRGWNDVLARLSALFAS